MCRGISRGIDNLQLFNDRARPSVRNNERQSIFMFRANVDEMDIQPIDVCNELWQGLQSSFDLPPIIICSPIMCEFLNRGKLYALAPIWRCTSLTEVWLRDRFLFGPPCRIYAPAQFGKFGFRNTYMKRTNFHSD